MRPLEAPDSSKAAAAALDECAESEDNYDLVEDAPPPREAPDDMPEIVRARQLDRAGGGGKVEARVRQLLYRMQSVLMAKLEPTDRADELVSIQMKLREALEDQQPRRRRRGRRP